MDDPADLLWIKLRKLLSWHVVNKEVVSDERVSIDSLLVGLGDSLSKDSRILRVEEKVNSRELDVLAGHVPLSAVHSSLFVPGLDKDCSPLTDAILVLSEALGRNGSKVAFFICSKFNPLVRKAAIVLEIIEWLKREPLSSVLLTGADSVVDAQLQE